MVVIVVEKNKTAKRSFLPKMDMGDPHQVTAFGDSPKALVPP